VRWGPARIPLAAVSRLITVGLLPAEIREGYGFAWDAPRDRRFRTAITCIRRARRVLPPMLREWRMARV
jgi:uncharacterized protein (DUF2236 family)